MCRRLVLQHLAQLVPTARAARADGSCSSALCDLCMCPDLPPSTVACRCTASWRTVVNGRRFGNNDRATWRTINIPMRFPSGDRKGEYLWFLSVTNNLVRWCLSSRTLRFSFGPAQFEQYSSSSTARAAQLEQRRRQKACSHIIICMASVQEMRCDFHVVWHPE